MPAITINYVVVPIPLPFSSCSA